MEFKKEILRTIRKNSAIFYMDEDMSFHCSLRCGGTANYYCEPKNKKSFGKIVELCLREKITHVILGYGTNVLFKNFSGIVICTKNLRNIEFENDYVIAEAGVNLFKLNMFVCNCNLSGLEWSYGIPGSVGGACIMNAGAYEHEIGEIIEKVEIFENGRFKTLHKNKFWFSYRNSSFKEKNFIVTKVYFSLKKENNNEIIKNSMLEFFKKRKNSQPLELPNAGSIFKRKGEMFPAKLIDKIGLKGVNINGAEVSTKHAGFIVNKGGAKPEDILQLIDLIKQKVFETENVKLDEEIVIIKNQKQKNNK